MKFGGTSVADAERIVNAAALVQERLHRRPLVVVSALAGVTDLLEHAVAAARSDDLEGQRPLLADIERRHRWALSGSLEDAGRRHDLTLEIDACFDDLRQLLRSIRILGEGTPRASDAILAFGERMSSRILCSVLQSRGVDACWIDPRAVMITDKAFAAATPDLERTADACAREIVPLLEGDKVPVVGGFVGSPGDGTATTLGRGGSDTTAAVLGAVLGAEEIQIWTDVDGLMTADPRIVPGAGTLERISFAEAAELAFHGAKVLHPAAIAPAVRRSIPVRILNSLKPESEGTEILEDCRRTGQPIASVASRTGVAVLHVTTSDMRAVSTVLGPMMGILAEHGAAPELLVTSEVTASAVLPAGTDPAAVRTALADALDVTVEHLADMAILCVVGSGIASGQRIRAEVLATLAGIDPEAVAVGGSSSCVAAVVPAARLEEAVRVLHARFFDGGGEG